LENGKKRGFGIVQFTSVTSAATALKQLNATVLLGMYIFMVALCNGADHYIFALEFLSIFFFFFSSPNFSGRRLDVYHTSTHGVALVRI